VQVRVGFSNSFARYQLAAFQPLPRDTEPFVRKPRFVARSPKVTTEMANCIQAGFAIPSVALVLNRSACGFARIVPFGCPSYIATRVPASSRNIFVR
jgi:hypothetical protein